jgi:hypothetical protein
MKKNLILFVLYLGSIFLVGCSFKATPDPNVQIQLAVASTLAAIPSPVPAPTDRPIPTPTPFSLTGLFCEYQFCIGHPPEMPFYDVVAKQNPGSTTSSTNEYGILAAHNSSLFIQFMWQYSPSATDPAFLMDLSLNDGLATSLGNNELRLIHDMNVLSSPITTTVPLLPFGGVAGWVCGERVFAWKVYTPQDGIAEVLLQEALAQFRCK